MGGLRAEGPRVGLRPVRDADLPFIEQLGSGISGAARGLAVITRAAEDSPIGVLWYRLDVPSPGWAFIDYVALAEDARRWGLGQEAVRLFEADSARRSRVQHFRTEIDTGQGLALYFWLRLGYRPAEPASLRGSRAFYLQRDA